MISWTEAIPTTTKDREGLPPLQICEQLRSLWAPTLSTQASVVQFHWDNVDAAYQTVQRPGKTRLECDAAQEMLDQSYASQTIASLETLDAGEADKIIYDMVQKLRAARSDVSSWDGCSELEMVAKDIQEMRTALPQLKKEHEEILKGGPDCPMAVNRLLKGLLEIADGARRHIQGAIDATENIMDDCRYVLRDDL